MSTFITIKPSFTIGFSISPKKCLLLSDQLNIIYDVILQPKNCQFKLFQEIYDKKQHSAIFLKLCTVISMGN